MTTIDRLEDKAIKDTDHEHEARFGSLIVIWDGGFEYYQRRGLGDLRTIDRTEAIDLLSHEVRNAIKDTGISLDQMQELRALFGDNDDRVGYYAVDYVIGAYLGLDNYAAAARLAVHAKPLAPVEAEQIIDPRVGDHGAEPLSDEEIEAA